MRARPQSVNFMTDAVDFEDDARTPSRATVKKIALYLWRRWRSQPRKLTLFAVLFGLSAACELMLPWMAQKLVSAMSAGPGAAATGAAWTYGAFTLVAFFFYL